MRDARRLAEDTHAISSKTALWARFDRCGIVGRRQLTRHSTIGAFKSRAVLPMSASGKLPRNTRSFAEGPLRCRLFRRPYFLFPETRL